MPWESSGKSLESPRQSRIPELSKCTPILKTDAPVRARGTNNSRMFVYLITASLNCKQRRKLLRRYVLSVSMSLGGGKKGGRISTSA